jgi:hypothetical protein
MAGFNRAALRKSTSMSCTSSRKIGSAALLFLMRQANGAIASGSLQPVQTQLRVWRLITLDEIDPLLAK